MREFGRKSGARRERSARQTAQQQNKNNSKIRIRIDGVFCCEDYYHHRSFCPSFPSSSPCIQFVPTSVSTRQDRTRLIIIVILIANLKRCAPASISIFCDCAALYCAESVHNCCCLLPLFSFFFFFCEANCYLHVNAVSQPADTHTKPIESFCLACPVLLSPRTSLLLHT